MSLRERARADMERITSDTKGFGWPIRIISPKGESRMVVGFSGDIGMTIDAGTGLYVTGRKAYCSIAMSQLEGMAPPRGIMDPKTPPWIIQFDSVMGKKRTYRVIECMPDEALGLYVCTLEAHRVLGGGG